MRLLIFLLALTSAFFVSANPPDMSDLVRPKLEEVFICHEYSRQGSKQTRVSGIDVCVSMASEGTKPNTGTNNDATFSNFRVKDTSREKKPIIYDATFERGSPTYGASSNFSVEATSEYTNTCPPDTNPEHTISVVDENGEDMCAKPLVPQDCPAGYHSKAVSKALGSSECVPKECPPAGSGEALYTSPNLGVSFSGGGMYCNDGCAYSVSAANITSDKHATGTSQGAACGDKPYDNKKLADEGDNDKCSTASNGDVTILSCEAATPTNDPKDPLDNDDSKTGDEPTPDKPKENCADGDTICNLKNLEIQMQNSAQQTIDNQNELHNKQVDVQTKNTQAIIDSIDGLDTSIYLQTQQDERLHAVTVSKFNELIGAVNGIETGGGGGGSGNGNGSGESDCEGSAADCVPIEGGELPVETVNLEQYADKYDDWLPNAELPEEKCIVLTTGKSICLSFEAFILLFKAISGLLVIGALMHSAKIIAGAV